MKRRLYILVFAVFVAHLTGVLPVALDHLASISVCDGCAGEDAAGTCPSHCPDCVGCAVVRLVAVTPVELRPPVLLGLRTPSYARGPAAGEAREIMHVPKILH